MMGAPTDVPAVSEQKAMASGTPDAGKLDVPRSALSAWTEHLRDSVLQFRGSWRSQRV